MPNESSMRAIARLLTGLLLLSTAVSCAAKPAPPDFRVLRLSPVMGVEAESEAIAFEGTALSDFAWECNTYGAYIDALRESAK